MPAYGVSFPKNSASTCPLGGLLVVDWVSPHDPWDDLVAFVFDGGALPHSSPVRLMDGELSGVGWYTPQMASRLLPARTWRRAEAALTAAAKGTAVYLTDGYPARLSGSFSLPVTSR